jgi:hypothetical protein
MRKYGDRNGYAVYTKYPPPDDWPLDVVRQDENGVDLAQIEANLELTPAEMLTNLERFAAFIHAARTSGGTDPCSNSERSSGG